MIEKIRCGEPSCEVDPREYWLIKTEIGMIERHFCYAHALDRRLEDKANFGDAYVPGSDEGEQ